VSIVIDVDAHFEPGPEWLDKYPDLARRLPNLDGGELAVKVICGDLVRSIPEERRPSMQELMPPGLLTLFAQEKADEKDRRAEFEGKNQMEVANTRARLKWMDSQGIDLQNVICLSGITYQAFVDDLGLRQETVRAANEWLADTCDEGGGRLLPVTALDYEDLDWAIAELKRMRMRGSRIVLVPGAPVAGKSVVHPDWDPFWRAVTDNGMMAMLHTGFERMSFDPGWSNMAADPTLLRQFGGGFRHVTAMMNINAMVFSGLFERHPTLTLTVAELGVGWLPFVLNDIDERATPTAELFLGKWKYPNSPSEYIRRNVRGTPLDCGSDNPLELIMQQLPEDMLMFSSDFPHFEGFNGPAEHYRVFFEKHADRLSAQRRDLFMGGNALAVFDRMGDPLKVPGREPQPA
jgi:Predicted metal-dependent hydrolase of the TIM-barrel fold